MTWHGTWPEGNKSVKGNKLFGQENTTYIETTNQIDHYWDEDINKDGHHRQVQMPMTGDAATPADVALATSMDGAFFVKAKSAANSLDNQDVQPFFINNKAVGTPGATAVMQLLGIRAMGHFTVDQTTPFAITTQYVYNVNPSTNPTPGIVRDGTGKFTVTFANALPSDNYLVLGSGIVNTSVVNGIALVGLQSTGGGGAASTTVKSKTRVKLQVLRADDMSGINPLTCWFVVFGG